MSNSYEDQVNAKKARLGITNEVIEAPQEATEVPMSEVNEEVEQEVIISTDEDIKEELDIDDSIVNDAEPEKVNPVKKPKAKKNV
jgi:hypothetical protein